MPRTDRWSILVVVTSIAALAAVGLIDWWIGQSLKRDISVLPLYLGPICLTAWLIQGRAWMSVVAFAGLAWYLAQVLDPTQKLNGMGVLAWNGLGRLVVFAVVGALVAKVRSLQRRTEEGSTAPDPTGFLSREALYAAMTDPGRLGDCSTPPSAILLLDVEPPLTAPKGHRREQGVLVAALVANAMRQCLRPGDFCTRLNDAQFGLILPRTNQAHAQEVARAIRENLEAASVSLKHPFVLTTLLCTSETLSVDTPELLKHADFSLVSFKASAPGQHRTTSIERSEPSSGFPGTLPATS